jgi:transcriptional regulator with XRE-family HTH domain
MAWTLMGRCRPANLFAMAANHEDRVRARLRQLRFERGLTLAEVAAAAGMATSTLSRLERGARGLTLAHVDRLAGALGVDADELLARRRGGDPEPQSRDGKRWWPLTEESTTRARAYRVAIPADLRDPEPRSHEGHQWLYVLRGRLRLVLGERDMVLETGEAAQFHTWDPHWTGAVDGPVELLVIFSPEGRPLRTIRPGPA